MFLRLHHHLLLLLCSAASSAAAEQVTTNSHIPLNSSLTPTANPTWLSPSRTFAFGFYSTPSGYAVCIFDRSRTVVWTANSDTNPILSSGDNVVLLLTRDGLILQRSDTRETFSRIDNSSRPIAGASMLDNGNFVLFDSRENLTWQSFDHPTNTLLPGQRLPPGAELLSRASETDLGKGYFRLKMQNDGNLVLYNVHSLDVWQDSYYASGTNGRGSNISLNLESDGHLYLFDGASVILNMSVGGGYSSFYLARIDSDGIFRLYRLPLPAKHGWKPVWSVTQDRCLPKGLCGINSYCSYSYNGSAECKCIPGYYSYDFGLWSCGCISTLAVDCSDKNQSSMFGSFGMERIANVTWEDNYYSALSGASEEGCEEACLKDCNCHVALFSNGECRMQKLPLRYGRWLESIEDVAFVRVNSSSPGLTWPSGDGRRHADLRVTLGVSFGIVGLLISSLIIVYYTRTKCGCCTRGKGSIKNLDRFLLRHGSLAPKRYSCRKIKKITRSFADKLGEGVYGKVYKGKLRDGQLVAVKVLKETHDNAEEFINEVVSISRTSHVNIVSLLGYCYHGNERALVYEFMPNKSLDKLIYERKPNDPNCSLEWKKLYEIAVGVARGLEYLHRGCNTSIIHFDIKPQNILLDEDFSPKISDFGLAKLYKKKQSVISMTGTRGTIGYIAPEVFSRTFGVVSHKSDVYSYGIMLLHMVEAKYVKMESFSLSDHYFFDKVYNLVLVQNERVDDLMTEEEEESARKMLMVGFWCIQTSPMDRPSMSKAVEMLEGKLESIQIPPRAFLLSSPNLEVPSFISFECKCTELGKGDLDSYPRLHTCLHG